MKKYLLSYIFVSLIVLIGVILINTKLSFAQDGIMENTSSYSKANCINNSCGSNTACKQYCGAYQLNDFIILGIKITKIMLGLVGTLAFGAFIYGGVNFLISGGKKEMVEIGKKSMINAIIGLVIVFSSYLIIQFTLQTLGYTDANGNIIDSTYKNGGTWNKAPQ